MFGLVLYDLGTTGFPQYARDHASWVPWVAIVGGGLRQFRRSGACAPAASEFLKSLAVGPGMIAPGGQPSFVRFSPSSRLWVLWRLMCVCSRWRPPFSFTFGVRRVD